MASCPFSLVLVFLSGGLYHEPHGGKWFPVPVPPYLGGVAYVTCFFWAAFEPGTSMVQIWECHLRTMEWQLLSWARLPIGLLVHEQVRLIKEKDESGLGRLRHTTACPRWLHWPASDGSYPSAPRVWRVWPPGLLGSSIPPRPCPSVEEK